VPIERNQVRGTILAEDRRTERFVRELVVCLGFDKRKFRFSIAPSGKGNASNWVRAQYVVEVNLLRRKRYQRLCLIAVRDGDNDGFAVRKAHLDAALASPREADEAIATLVPTWSIETWLFALLGDDTIGEDSPQKQNFENLYRGRAERYALRDAAQAWPNRADQVDSVPSLADGKAELGRIDPR
jgi:hypothetical protein